MPRQNHFVRWFDVLAADVARVPMTDFGQATSLVIAVRAVDGVDTANIDLMVTHDFKGRPIVRILVHKCIGQRWGTLAPTVQAAINRCCDPSNRESAQLDEIDGFYFGDGNLFAA